MVSRKRNKPGKQSGIFLSNLVKFLEAVDLLLEALEMLNYF